MSDPTPEEYPFHFDVWFRPDGGGLECRVRMRGDQCGPGDDRRALRRALYTAAISAFTQAYIDESGDSPEAAIEHVEALLRKHFVHTTTLWRKDS